MNPNQNNPTELQAYLMFLVDELGYGKAPEKERVDLLKVLSDQLGHRLMNVIAGNLSGKELEPMEKVDSKEIETLEDWIRILVKKSLNIQKALVQELDEFHGEMVEANRKLKG